MAPYFHVFVNGRKFDANDGVKEVMTGGEIAALVGVSTSRAVVRFDPRIDPKDLRIDTFRSSTPSGANRDCGVRITHLPSTLAVVSDTESSQVRNRTKAMQILRMNLYESGQLQPRRITAYEQTRVEVGDHFSVSSL